MELAIRRTMEMRVVQKSPNTDWDRVWRTLHVSCVSEAVQSEAVQSAWYLVIHELFPTNERLATIYLLESDTCRQCGRPDTLTHRLMECDNGTAIWDWTRRQVVTMLRTDPRHISKEWVLGHFQFWPPRKQWAILWTLPHLVWYRIQGRRRQSLIDYIDFMRRSRWKAYQHPKRLQQMGKYLIVL
jgi:hypothetical protein